jgi:hypothetical protein
VLTYTIVSEEPIPSDIAHEFLLEQLDMSPARAAESRARRELRKRIREHTSRNKAAGGTVRGLPGSGEPGSGQPGSGEPGSGQPPHKPSVSKGLGSLRSPDPGKELGDAPAESPVPAEFRAEFEARRQASGGQP